MNIACCVAGDGVSKASKNLISSNANALGICAGAGIPPKKIKKIVGIIKAYTSRVGGGVFPTEINDKIADKIREQGQEYGTVTHRPRRIGWLDLVNIKYGIIINGVNDIVITLLDALEGIETLYICTEYELNGNKIDYWPIQSELVEKCKPLYKKFDGWEPHSREEWTNIAKSGYKAIPKTMKIYLDFIKEFTKTKIAMISIGPDRNDTIILNKKIF